MVGTGSCRGIHGRETRQQPFQDLYAAFPSLLVVRSLLCEMKLHCIQIGVQSNGKNHDSVHIIELKPWI